MIAITGASGFIGSYITPKLPYSKKCLSRHPKNNTNHCTWILGDLHCDNHVHEFVQDTPTLIHLACNSTPRTSDQNRMIDIQDNLIPFINLLEMYAKHNPEGHIIFSSSGGNIYEANSPFIKRTESDIPAPRSSYGIHKLTIEHYIRLICETKGLRGTILRISNPYGVFLPKHRPQGLIGVAFSKLLSKEPLDLIDSLETVRDYIHLEDVAHAFNLAIRNPPKAGNCNVYNVGFGKGHSIEEVLNLIEAATSQEIVKRYSLANDFKPTWTILSYEKIKNELGWSPMISLPDGIKCMWDMK